MTEHNRVVAICCGRNPDNEVGFVLVWTPAMVKAEFKRVDAEIANLNKDVYAWWSASQSMPKAEQDKRDRFKDAWRTFVDGWKDYYDSASKFPGTGWGGHANRVQQYGADAIRWRDEFTKLGGNPTGPAPRAPESGFPWKTAIITGGIVVGAIFLVPWAVKKYG